MDLPAEERQDQSVDASTSEHHGQPDVIYLSHDGSVRTVVVAAACPAAMQRNTPWVISDFDLHKQLYKGKASVLYSATCKLSGLHLALKLYRKPRLSDLNWFQVTREIKIHSALRHAHIIDLYAAFEDADNVYLVQEFAYGGDLFGELKRCGGRFKDKNVARDVVRPCLLALRYCHHKGIIHRDLKPENILLTKHKQIKLADFGLSIDATQERPVTRAGTLDYMAPEVLVCPEKSRPQENKDQALLTYTHAVDVWAIGILAFECLCGKPPFERASRTETYEYIMYRRQQCPNYFTQHSVDFIHRALSKAATKRAAVTELLDHAWIMQYSAPPLAEARISAFRAPRVNLGPASSGGLPSPEASSLGSRTPSGMKEMVGSGSLDTLAQTIGPKDQAKVSEESVSPVPSELKVRPSEISIASMSSASSWSTMAPAQSDAASLSSQMSTQLSLLGPMPERAHSAALPGQGASSPATSTAEGPASLRNAASSTLGSLYSKRAGWKFGLKTTSSPPQRKLKPSNSSSSDVLSTLDTVTAKSSPLPPLHVHGTSARPAQ